MEKDLVLEMRNISKAFPGVQALDSVTFTVKRGEVHCLVGQNGSGKSTLIKILAGYYLQDSGDIFVNGLRRDIRTPRDAIKAGLGFIFQELNVIEQLTVQDNIIIGRERTRIGIIDDKNNKIRVEKVLNVAGIDLKCSDKVGKLSPGQKQMVEIARALSMNASIIVMDEPSAALGKHELDNLFRVIKLLKDNGVTIIYVSHRLEEIFTIGDRVTILRDGKLINVRNIKSITKEILISDMIGKELASEFPSRTTIVGEPILVLKDISRLPVLHNINITLKRGEILGIYGVVGSGRTELARTIFGIQPADSGKILINSKLIRPMTPVDALHLGIALVPEERKTEGIIGLLDVEENICLASLGNMSTMGIINRKKMQINSEKYIKKLKIKTPSRKHKVQTLSGGNQQKIVIAKWLLINPSVLILDEPTKGIDVEAKREIYELLRSLADNGTGIMIMSSDIREIMGISDRIIVLRNGRIVFNEINKDITQEDVVRYAIGEEYRKN